MRRAAFAGVALLLAGLLAAAAWCAFAPLEPGVNVLTFTIPKGTWARRQAGEKFDLIPALIHLTMGVRDVLAMKNDDDVPQLFGPVLIMPGQSFRLPFRQPSTYLFSCPLHTSGQLSVVVEPLPDAGWPRLRERIAALRLQGGTAGAPSP